MSELSLRERLQPSLLDRLIDDERLITLFDLSIELTEHRRLQISIPELEKTLVTQGLAPAGLEGSSVVSEERSEVLCLRYSAPYGSVSPPQLKTLKLSTPAHADGVALGDIFDVNAYNVVNHNSESADRRYAAARRLRAYVCRDLAMLLNSTSLDTTTDLSTAPHVKRSVVNYGMPSPSGKSMSSINLSQTARLLEQVIRQFEPRLMKVRIVPDTDTEGADPHEICFRIDCELWGQPAPHQLVLRTRINIESGDARVDDSGPM